MKDGGAGGGRGRFNSRQAETTAANDSRRGLGGGGGGKCDHRHLGRGTPSRDITTTNANATLRERLRYLRDNVTARAAGTDYGICSRCSELLKIPAPKRR